MRVFGFSICKSNQAAKHCSNYEQFLYFILFYVMLFYIILYYFNLKKNPFPCWKHKDVLPDDIKASKCIGLDIIPILVPLFEISV